MAVEITKAVVFIFVCVLKSEAFINITVCMTLNPLKMRDRNRTLDTGINKGSLNNRAMIGAQKKSAT